jgi:hypothetical protein
MKNITIFRSKFPVPKQGKKFMSTYICKHFSFDVQLMMCCTQSFAVSSVWKTLLYSDPTENEQAFHQGIDTCQNNRDSPRTSGRGARVHDQKHPCIHSFRWKTDHLL